MTPVNDCRQLETTATGETEIEQLRALYNELIYAVASRHKGETRHETALRYIREVEKHIEGPCVESSIKIPQPHEG